MAAKANKLHRSVIAKTTSYSVLVSDFGAVFTTRGAGGAVTFTLPAVASSYAGVDILFVNCADQDMIVAGTAGELVFKHDLAANSVAYSTSSEKIGGAFHAICDGTSWLMLPLAEEAQTITVVT